MRSLFRRITDRLVDRGYFHVGTWSGMPIRIHWTAVIGALLFGRFEWAPAFWFAFIFIIVVHEMGHGVLVRHVGAEPVSLDVHGLGGLCRWRGTVTPLNVAIIAWGGVAAQFILYLLAMAAIAIFGAPSTPATMQLRNALIESNFFLIILNLIPVPPLDGSKAWQLPGLLLARMRERRREKARKLGKARRNARNYLRLVDNAEAKIPRVQSEVDEILRKATAKSENENGVWRK